MVCWVPAFRRRSNIIVNDCTGHNQRTLLVVDTSENWGQLTSMSQSGLAVIGTVQGARLQPARTLMVVFLLTERMSKETNELIPPSSFSGKAIKAGAFWLYLCDFLIFTLSCFLSPLPSSFQITVSYLLPGFLLHCCTLQGPSLTTSETARDCCLCRGSSLKKTLNCEIWSSVPYVGLHICVPAGSARALYGRHMLFIQSVSANVNLVFSRPVVYLHSALHLRFSSVSRLYMVPNPGVYRL